MYSNEDLERFYFRYQAEALPHGTSLQAFCLNNNVPYNIFSKWYKDTRRKVVEVQVQGRPSSECQSEEIQPVQAGNGNEDAGLPHEARPVCSEVQKVDAKGEGPVRIWLELHLSNGLYLSRKNLSYRQLLQMVEKLEGLC